MSSSRLQVLSAYKNLLKAASKWGHYGFREYTKIRTREAFKQNKGLTDQEAISKCIKDAHDSVGIFIYVYIYIRFMLLLYFIYIKTY